MMYKKNILSLLISLSVSVLATASGPRWVPLFNGKNLGGWIQKNGTATYRIEDRMIIGKTTPKSPNSFLCTENEYGDFELRFDVKLLDDDLNSGVQIRSKTFEPKNGQKFGQVNGPQVEIMASGKAGGSSGYIYGEALSKWLTPADKRIRHQFFKDKKWNSYRIVAKGARIQTWINGNQISDLHDEESFKSYSKGFIGLQVHGVGERGPYQVAWRRIRIKIFDK